MSVIKVIADVGDKTYELETEQENLYNKNIVAENGTNSVLVTAIDESGNATIKAEDLIVNNSWYTPKVDWTAEDFFNLIDYERIVGNIQYLQAESASMYSMTELKEMEDKTPYGYSAIPYPTDLNAIEQNLATIDADTYNSGFLTKEWKSNKPAPTYEDYNRWEELQRKTHEMLTAQKNAQNRLAFTLGCQKGFKV